MDNQDLVRHCEKLETKLGQLDKIRQKQAKKITSLKEDMNISETGGEERMGKAEKAIQALSSELKTTKQLLEDMGQRERQVGEMICMFMQYQAIFHHQKHVQNRTSPKALVRFMFFVIYYPSIFYLSTMTNTTSKQISEELFSSGRLMLPGNVMSPFIIALYRVLIINN